MAAAQAASLPVDYLVFLVGATVPIFIAFGLVGLTGFRELTRYQAHNSFFYRLNPATKILALFLVAFSLSSASMWLGLAATLTILVSYVTLEHGPRKFVLGLLFTVAVVWAAVWGAIGDRLAFVLNGPAGQSGILFRYVPRIVAYDFAVSGVFLLALILVMTSTPASVVRALRKIRFPNPITFSLVVGMKSVPTLLEAINSTVKVQFMRGFGSRASRTLWPFYTIAAILLALIPSLIFVLRGARNTAISTGTRAFGAYKTRTYLTEPPFGVGDVLLICLAAGFFLAVLLT